MNKINSGDTSDQGLLEDFEELVSGAYSPLKKTLSVYSKYQEVSGTPLTSQDIDVLEYRLRVANERVDLMRKCMQMAPERIVQIFPEWDTNKALSQSEYEEMINYAWIEQTITENELSKVLRYSSQQAKYFPRTFEALERVEVENVDKLQIYDKVKIASIAHEERTGGARSIYPRYMKIAHAHKNVVTRIFEDILKDTEYWESQGMPLIGEGSMDESTPDHPSLMTQISGNEFVPDGAPLGRHMLQYAIANGVHDEYLYSIFSDFLLEEMELINRLNIWYRMQGMYQPFNISPYLARNRA